MTIKQILIIALAIVFVYIGALWGSQSNLAQPMIKSIILEPGEGTLWKWQKRPKCN